MIKIRIYTIGKEKSLHFDGAITEFEKRLKGRVQIDWVYPKNASDLIERLEKEEDYIALDEAGELVSSIEFSKMIADKARLVFVIGGAEGLPEALKRRPGNLSLSPMTFPHQMCRLILVEQLFRAYEILQGKPYHK